MTLFLILPATVAYASFFSIFGDIFTKVSMQTKPINSQNISLLAAAAGPDISRTASTDVNTVDGSALLPDAGPTGGLADVNTDEDSHGQISLYVVHSGDSLASIAKMFDVSVNTLLWANNLPRGAKLSIGQTLVILPVSGVEHTAKKGDTIESISKKYHADPDEVRSYNGLSINDTLEAGAVIIVPDGEMPTTVKISTKPATSNKLRGANGPSYDGYYASPLVNFRRTQGLHGYNGVDLAEYLGAPVMASAEGDVIVSREGGYNGGYGNYVVIQHGNDTQTLYGHLQSTAVIVGDHVAQGQTIGYLGNTGRSTGPHLHFEVRGAKNPFGY